MEQRNPWYSLGVDEVIRQQGSDGQKGLSTENATRRFQVHGANALSESERRSVLTLFLSQLNNVLIYILIAAAALSGFLGEYTDAIVIGAVILINAVVGVIQEHKAERSLEALKKMASPKALVIRDGSPREIPTELIVPGDIVLIDAGRIIPCDLRLIESASLKIDESSLTGESVAADKDSDAVFPDTDTPLGDRSNMAYASTVATYGRGIGVAVGTGMDTEIGAIAGMLEQTDEGKTPLQERLDSFGRILGYIVLGLSGLMFLIGIAKPLFREGNVPGDELIELFFTAVSLAVAVIPEGLPAIVTLVLALGVQRMIKRNAIVKRLPAVETLGSVNVICSDKTGTLTMNRMTVTEYQTPAGERTSIDDIDLSDEGQRRLVEAMVLCNDAEIDDDGEMTGDPTEIALIAAGRDAGMRKADLLTNAPRAREIPFDSVRKLMTTIHSLGSEELVATKGALSSILNVCTTYYGKNGETVPLDEATRHRILEDAEDLSSRALRVLGAADRTCAAGTGKEADLTYLGFVGMIDPPRLEVKDSIAQCAKAGIRTVMITGDHGSTAFAIADSLGLASDRSQVLQGKDLDDLNDKELESRIDSLRVFARVSPEHKVRIVTSLRSKGYIVSMTGDGVNDAPSLKSADIGVAMGITGTDVAKSAADMVLTDDNFSTIVSAVEEGRNIYQNIKKSILFLLSSNVGEFIAVFAAVLSGMAMPLLPIHILWVNLITDSLPALSLGVDPGDSDVMSLPPRDRRESIFSHKGGIAVILNGVLIGSLTLTAFFIGFGAQRGGDLVLGRTYAFAVLSITQLFHAFNLRNTVKSIFSIGLLTNPYLVGAFVVGGAIQVLIISLPAAARVFKVVPLSASDWLTVVALAIVPLVLNEVVKLVFRLRKR